MFGKIIKHGANSSNFTEKPHEPLDKKGFETRHVVTTEKPQTFSLVPGA